MGVVYVVAKAPRPGSSKTRLVPPLSPDQAARVATAFLLDTLELVRSSGFHPRVVCRDAGEQAALQALLGPHVPVLAQPGGGLGDALASALQAGLADGFPAAAVLAADSPTLPPDVLRQAFASQADVALGPSRDGGYYLLSARSVHPALFHDMPWSTAAVFDETVRRCALLGLHVRQLPTWYDVDDVADLVRLRAELLAGPQGLAPHTRAALAGVAAEEAVEDEAHALHSALRVAL
jgi:rSAM/selenodomain-associated transferase 1